MYERFEDRFASAFARARKNFHKPSKKIMTEAATSSRTLDYKEEILKLKVEFEEKFRKTDKSGTQEGLKSFKFMTILGQGAFGVVVIIRQNKYSGIN